jgi:hypothetical protein
MFVGRDGTEEDGLEGDLVVDFFEVSPFLSVLDFEAFS